MDVNVTACSENTLLPNNVQMIRYIFMVQTLTQVYGMTSKRNALFLFHTNLV